MLETLTNIQIKGACLFDEPLAKHTTFNIGGRVGLWIEPQDLDDLKMAINQINANGFSWRVIGNGSNILAGEYGLPDVVIKLSSLNKLTINGYTITAGSGVSLARLVGFSIENGLSGLEFLAGIPGQVGGSIKGNCGAHGRSIASVLKEICVMDREGNVYEIPSDKISFGYRYSDLGPDIIILSGTFRLARGDKERMQEIVRGYLSRRNSIFPKEPNAGCIFKNPPDISAGRLIEGLGLKGFTIGKAMVSYQHANIIVNLGGATSMDVYSLIEYVRGEVLGRAGISLDLEIDCWGDL